MSASENSGGPHRTLGILLTLLLLVGGGILVWNTESKLSQLSESEPPPTPAAAPARPRPMPSNAPGRIQLDPPDPASLAKIPPSPLALALGANGTPPAREPDIVLNLLVFYRRQFGDFPAGADNRQVVNALRGANPGKLPILPFNHPRLSPGGELLDAWDQPFFFHQISREEVQVRSAGPDRQLFTDDDLISTHGKPATGGGSPMR